MQGGSAQDRGNPSKPHQQRNSSSSGSNNDDDQTPAGKPTSSNTMPPNNGADRILYRTLQGRDRHSSSSNPNDPTTHSHADLLPQKRSMGHDDSNNYAQQVTRVSSQQASFDHNPTAINDGNRGNNLIGRGLDDRQYLTGSNKRYKSHFSTQASHPATASSSSGYENAAAFDLQSSSSYFNPPPSSINTQPPYAAAAARMHPLNNGSAPTYDVPYYASARQSPTSYIHFPQYEPSSSQPAPSMYGSDYRHHRSHQQMQAWYNSVGIQAPSYHISENPLDSTSFGATRSQQAASGSPWSTRANVARIPTGMDTYATMGGVVAPQQQPSSDFQLPQFVPTENHHFLERIMPNNTSLTDHTSSVAAQQSGFPSLPHHHSAYQHTYRMPFNPPSMSNQFATSSRPLSRQERLHDDVAMPSQTPSKSLDTNDMPMKQQSSPSISATNAPGPSGLLPWATVGSHGLSTNALIDGMSSTYDRSDVGADNASNSMAGRLPLPAEGDKILHYSARRPISLASDEDHNWLSEFLCFVREDLVEVFRASEADVRTRNSSKKVVYGQVGIRCRFCAHVKMSSRASRSSSYPSSLTRIYQSLTMMLRDHFGKCTSMPMDLQEKFLKLKGKTSQGATDSKHYWMYSAMKLGLIDSPNGIWINPDPMPLGPNPEPFRGTANLTEPNPFGGYLGQSQPKPPVYLVDAADKSLVPEFLYLLMAQVQKVEIDPTERTGNRKTLPPNLPGLGCRHCYQANRKGLCRLFPGRRRTLPGKVYDLWDHIRRCPLCPLDVRNRLAHLHTQLDGDELNGKRPGEREFFDRIWSRLGHNSPSAEFASSDFYG